MSGAQQRQAPFGQTAALDADIMRLFPGLLQRVDGLRFFMEHLQRAAIEITRIRAVVADRSAHHFLRLRYRAGRIEIGQQGFDVIERRRNRVVLGRRNLRRALSGIEHLLEYLCKVFNADGAQSVDFVNQTAVRGQEDETGRGHESELVAFHLLFRQRPIVGNEVAIDVRDRPRIR